MTKPPQRVARPDHPVRCTSSNAAPVLDTICAGYFVVNGIGWMATDCFGDAACESTQAAGILLSAGLVGLCGASAATGFGSASRCDDVTEQNAMCIAGRDEACRALDASWIPRQPKLAIDPAPERSRPPCQPRDPELERLRPAGYVSPEEEDCEPVPSAEGCGKDSDCKGDRVCERGVCRSPAGTAGAGEVTPVPRTPVVPAGGGG